MRTIQYKVFTIQQRASCSFIPPIAGSFIARDRIDKKKGTREREREREKEKAGNRMYAAVVGENAPPL